MAYRFAVERGNYADLASGAVLRSAPGLPAFPVRLASEVFLRATALREKELGIGGPCALWDPLCGSGYLLTVLGLLHGDAITGIVASDVDPGALAVARANLALLTPAGLEARRAELEQLAQRYGKESHRAALEAAGRIADLLRRTGRTVPATVAEADAGDPDAVAAIAEQHPPDVVITDVPYGEQVGWAGTGGVAAVLAAMTAGLPRPAVVAVVGRGRRIEAGPHRPVQTARVGTRAVALFTVPGA